MRAVCIGNSHMGALLEAAQEAMTGDSQIDIALSFILYHLGVFQPPVTEELGQKTLNRNLSAAITAAYHAQNSTAKFAFMRIGRSNPTTSNAAIFSLVGGNLHNVFGLLKNNGGFDIIPGNVEAAPSGERIEAISEQEIYDYFLHKAGSELADLFVSAANDGKNISYHIESPPPIPSNEHIIKFLDPYFDKFGKKGLSDVSSSALRYKLWRIHSRMAQDVCRRHGVTFVAAPPLSMDENGFLKSEYWPDNATHANAEYGRLILGQIYQICQQHGLPKELILSNPYANMRTTSFWRQSITNKDPSNLNPIHKVGFQVSRHDRVATAGSCFAQHIAKHLKSRGFSYFVVEQGHSALPEETRKRFSYGAFSARYGNIYTSRQLLQLFQRALGSFVPIDSHWKSSDQQGYVDPFRPAVQPYPFLSVQELLADRDRHLSAVRLMMKDLHVFVFTLGLTECWMNTKDGAVYPICPGVAGGEFDPEQHAFINLNVPEVYNDLTCAFKLLRSINPNARIILTVSPVPLKATASDDHVLTATTYSKAVLRAAAGMISKELPFVEYFPSYEIITGNFNRGVYYAENLRDVTPQGVEHVMRVFEEAFASEHFERSTLKADDLKSHTSDKQKALAEIICDEEMLEMEAILKKPLQ